MSTLSDTETGAAPQARPAMPDWAPVGLAALLTVVLGGALWTAGHLRPDPVLHEVALFAHLASLVLGFGAVLAVDWVALLWLLRQRPLADVLRTADNAHLPIWLGYAGLVVSGVLLEPDLASTATRVKLALVMVIGWNGAGAIVLNRRLARVGDQPPDPRLLRVAAGAAALSQAGWWGAMLVGFLNAR